MDTKKGGKLECWNVGILGTKENIFVFTSLHHSSIPLFLAIL
jgi:phosphotransferase system  glucose/maltose/N-acetylglucosamine-specific IIC component